uniref:Replication-relaxation n=1 Tax=candidate division CPR3 bacterium TaxID=2268181 RepID=A0A7V3N4Y3_UNCC3
MRTIPKERYLELSQVFHWATKEHYILMLTKKIERHRRTETMLPRLVRKGKLSATYYGKKLVYCALRKNRKRISGNEYYPTIEHGLACTEALVRFCVSDPNCELIAERYLRGHQIVPEWAILYPNKRLMFFEFCTKDNFKRRAVFKSKITRYQNNLDDLVSKFGEDGFVLFVIDAPREEIKKFIKELKAGEKFMFCDYQTFLSVPYGKQITEPIYIWGGDGKSYPLRNA